MPCGATQDAQVMVEIPTYPYDKERAQNLKGRILSAEDRHLMPRLKKYVDYIATYSKDETIAGVPCVNMQNGVVVDTSPTEIKGFYDLLRQLYQTKVHRPLPDYSFFYNDCVLSVR